MVTGLPVLYHLKWVVGKSNRMNSRPALTATNSLRNCMYQHF